MVIGIDFVAVKRLRRLTALSAKILHTEERVIFANLLTKRRKREFLAGRWALKEAVQKILTHPVVFSQYSIVLQANRLVIQQSKDLIPNSDQIALSLSHEKKYAVAVACR